MEITFLGTGAGLSRTTEMNTCAVLDRRLLLDAGLTVPQGLLRAELDVDDLDAVMITHFDPDHVLGFPLLTMRRSADKPLLVIGPEGVEEYLLNLCAAVRKGFYKKKLEFREIAASDFDVTHTTVGDYSITPLKTDHEPESQGYLITGSSGFTFFYGGDSKRCPGLERGVSLCDAAAIEMTEIDGRQERHLSMDHDLHLLFSKLGPAAKLFLVHRAHPREQYLDWIDSMELGDDARRILVPEDGQTFNLEV